jgi:hypothetical protein
MNARHARAVAAARERYVVGARDIEDIVLVALEAYEPIGVVEIAEAERKYKRELLWLCRVQ